ncbi:unnamed protein product [Clavelina lepadiformis]|uniref:VWFA domain-containing protein n=1 Tax=Clavelina lepadiformis TaxID=159417 RepID=A0ABP0FYC4_CLALP
MNIFACCIKLFCVLIIGCATLTSCQCDNIFSRFAGITCLDTTPTTPTATTTTTTTTTTPTTTTTTTTTTSSIRPKCNGKDRVWTFCDPVTLMRSTTDKCTLKSEKCDPATVSADFFISSFSQPPAAGGTTIKVSGGGVGARILPVGGGDNDDEKCFEIKDEDGDVIAGNCNDDDDDDDDEDGGNTRRKRQAPQVIQTKRDLLLILDESGSVGYYRFEKVKRIAAAIVRLLCDQIKVNPFRTRVAVMSFDQSIYFHVRLWDYYRQDLGYNGEALAKHITDQIQYQYGSAGGTCLNNALEFARGIVFTKQHGARTKQKDVEKDIIIITDGCANCFARGVTAKQGLRRLTRKLKKEGYHIYVIGINLQRSCKRLLRILARGGRCYHFFYLKQWEYDVEQFIYQLEHPPQGVCLNVFERPDGVCLAPLTG